MSDNHVGFDEMSKYPLFAALHNRRSRRISVGIQTVPAGSNTYKSNAKPEPLSELEEAVLISATGLDTSRSRLSGKMMMSRRAIEGRFKG